MDRSSGKNKRKIGRRSRVSKKDNLFEEQNSRGDQKEDCGEESGSILEWW